MNDDLFNWDDANILHLAEHDVTPEESEEVLLGEPMEMGQDPRSLGEERWSFAGETSEGRILQVVITMRNEKIRVVTAFEPIRRIKLRYLQSKAGKP